VLWTPQGARACTIPVFRYALERWELTPYEILVFHRGALPAEVQAALKPWSDSPNRANIEITLINLDEEVAPAHRKSWEQYARFERTPWVLVRSQPKTAPDVLAWNGPCTAANLDAVLHSPMRGAILANTTRGASINHVLLTSGNAKADRAVYDMARKELPALERGIKLGKQDEEGPNALKWPVPLKVSLPLLVLDRKDRAESAFVQMLLATEEGLDEVDGPILFAIFGRGRAVALYGKYLDETNLRGVTYALCGPCSCEVKDKNPGVDLLMVADWNALQDALFEGKNPVPMPKEMPTSLPYREDEMSAPPVEPVAVPAKSETIASVDLAPTRMETVIFESKPEHKPCCDLGTMLWIGTGLAGALVIGTGIWVASVLMRP
jgi:hypothetical protein